MKSGKYVAIFLVTLFMCVISPDSLSLASTDLKVVSAKPKGELKGIYEGKQITVTFNTPVVELKRIEDFKPDWFSIKPHVAGDFQWIGTKTLSFKPHDNLPVATEFKVMITTALKGLNGSRLKNLYAWTFQTPTPFVSYTYPRNNEKSVDTRVTVNLNFNMAVNPADMYRYLDFYEYREKEKGRKIEFEINSGKPDATNVMNIKPLQELKKDTSYLLVVRPGLPAVEGNLGSQTEWQTTFRTYEEFKFIGINKGEQQSVNPKKSITLNFTNPVEYFKLIKHLKFEPKISLKDYSHSYQQSSINIYGPFLPDTTYNIFISAELTDIFGNKLKNAIEESFKTRSYDAQYDIPRGESIIESYGDLNVPIEVVNLTDIQAKVKVVPFDSIDILGTWFTKKVQFSRKDVLGKRYHKVENIKTQIRKNRLRVVPFNLKKYLPDGKHGILLVQFYGKEDEESAYSYKSMFTQVTNLGITAKFSPVSNAIYVTKLKTGVPVGGVKVQIRDGSGKVYWSGVTDETGYCQSPGWQRLEMPASKNREPVQWAVAIADGDMAYTHSQKGTGISPWEFRIA